MLWPGGKESELQQELERISSGGGNNEITSRKKQKKTISVCLKCPRLTTEREVLPAFIKTTGKKRFFCVPQSADKTFLTQTNIYKKRMSKKWQVKNILCFLNKVLLQFYCKEKKASNQHLSAIWFLNISFLKEVLWCIVCVYSICYDWQSEHNQSNHLWVTFSATAEKNLRYLRYVSVYCMFQCFAGRGSITQQRSITTPSWC